jgi:hypothetical protein
LSRRGFEIMILRSAVLSGALICAVSLLTFPALAATPPKAAKPAATKSPVAKSAAKPAVAKPAPAKASTKQAPAAQTTYKLPTGGKPVAVPPPPADLTTPQKPAAQAAAPAKPKAQAKAPGKAKAKVAKKPANKKQIASGKGKKVKQGRAALSLMEKIDQGQLATDYLSGAESKSTLELLVSYKETLRDGDLETAGVLLRLIANENPSHELATTVNDLIGLPLDTAETDILIQIARADRADAVAGDTAKKGTDEKVASPLGERIHAAHAAVEAAPRTSRIEALAAYKHAVTEGNAEAAAIALSGVVQGPLNEAAVNTANALLGVENIISPDRLAAIN